MSIPYLTKTLTTDDNHTIACNHYKKGRQEVIVIAHGFYNNKDTILFKNIAELFAEHFDVLSFDFRGHGKSTGFFSWTAREVYDLRSVIHHAKAERYKKIGVIGFSLGAAIGLIEASENQAIDSIIAVSAPYDVRDIDFCFWEQEMVSDLMLNIGPKGKGKGIRPGNPFLKKKTPLAVVASIAPRPVLFLHGEKDWLIKPRHSERLYQAAREPKEMQIIPQAGHAEKIYDSFPQEFKQICLQWFARTLET